MGGKKKYIEMFGFSRSPSIVASFAVVSQPPVHPKENYAPIRLLMYSGVV